MPIDAKLLLAIENNHFAERKLNLESREIDDADAEKLATALKKNIHVKAVNLSDNPIRDVGIKALTAVKQLEEMDISQTLISAAGAVELEGFPRSCLHFKVSSGNIAPVVLLVVWSPK